MLGLSLVLERNWSALLRTAASAILLIALPWGFLNYFLTGPRMPSGTGFLAGSSTMLSWSLPAVALRAIHPPGPDGKPPATWINDNLSGVHLPSRDRTLSISVTAVTLLVGISIWTFSARLRSTRDVIPFDSGALIALTLAPAPVCWTHYEVLQYPGAALLLARSAQDSHWARFLAVLTSWLFLYTVPVTVLRAAYDAHHGWPAQPVYLYFWTSISAFASVSLFTLAVREGASTRPRKTLPPVAGVSLNRHC